MLHVDPMQRWTAAQVLSHPWITSRGSLPDFKLSINDRKIKVRVWCEYVVLKVVVKGRGFQNYSGASILIGHLWDQPFCPLFSFRGDFLSSVYPRVLLACPLLFCPLSECPLSFTVASCYGSSCSVTVKPLLSCCLGIIWAACNSGFNPALLSMENVL